MLTCEEGTIQIGLFASLLYLYSECIKSCIAIQLTVFIFRFDLLLTWIIWLNHALNRYKPHAVNVRFLLPVPMTQL
jgi:hypothetical protein